MHQAARAASAFLACLAWASAASALEDAPRDPGRRPLVIVGDRDYRPLSYLERGVPTGMDVEMGEAVAVALERPARVELLEWERAQEKIRAGEADVLLGMSVTEARKAAYEFSITPFEHEFAFFVRAGDVGVTGPADVAGKRVGVTEGGYPRAVLERRPGVVLVVVNGYRDGLDRLKAGDIDAFAADLWVGAYAIRADQVTGVTVAGVPFARQRYGMAVRKGDAATLADVNRALSRLERDGTIARIRERWRPHEIVFVSRQRFREIVAAGLAGLFLLAIGILALWIRSLNRHIAAQRRTEMALRESEELLRVAFATFPDAIVITRADGVVTSVNAGFTRLSGWSEAEIVGRTTADIGLWSDPAQRAAFLEAVQATGTVSNFEADFRRRDGALLTALISGRAITIQGQRYGLGMSRDITDRKAAEDAIHALVTRLQAAREEEKARIARDLHDDLGQLLTGIKMDLRWVEGRLGDQPESEPLNAIIDRVVEASALIDQTVATVQRIAADLRPSALDRLGLGDALRQEGRRFHERTGIACQVSLAGALPPLSGEAATALYRIAQEALTNVARHAEASHVTVTLRSDSDFLSLRVEDDGKGIGTITAGSRALGLLGMRERAARFGGEVTFARAPDRGTQVDLKVPIARVVAERRAEHEPGGGDGAS